MRAFIGYAGTICSIVAIRSQSKDSLQGSSCYTVLSQIRPQPITPSNHFSPRSSLALPPPPCKGPLFNLQPVASPPDRLNILRRATLSILCVMMALNETPRAFWSVKLSPDRLCLSLSHPKRGAWLRQTCCLYRQILFTSAGPPKVLLTCGIELRLVLLVRHDPSPGEYISADWETVLNLDCGWPHNRKGREGRREEKRREYRNDRHR